MDTIKKNYKFHYIICEYPITEPVDDELFEKQCKAIEKRFPNLKKEKLIKDEVFGNAFQLYHHEKGDIAVVNDDSLLELYIDSDFDLIPYFEKNFSEKLP